LVAPARLSSQITVTNPAIDQQDLEEMLVADSPVEAVAFIRNVQRSVSGRAMSAAGRAKMLFERGI
jgi:hypothetical protein